MLYIFLLNTCIVINHANILFISKNKENYTSCLRLKKFGQISQTLVCLEVVENFLIYSLRPRIYVVLASRETTLTKYILKNIIIYDT